jgi:hypothetical protein
MAEEAITIARGLADDALAADALAALNWFSFLQGDLPAALARADEAVALAKAAAGLRRCHRRPTVDRALPWPPAPTAATPWAMRWL